MRPLTGYRAGDMAGEGESVPDGKAAGAGDATPSVGFAATSPEPGCALGEERP